MIQRMSVSLEPKHIRAVEKYGKKIGVNAFSTALQALIHKFEQTELSEKQDDARPETKQLTETVSA